MMSKDLSTRIGDARLIAVVTIDDAAQAVPLAHALIEGGVSAIELTLRTPAALDALKNVVEGVPAILAGAGTVLTKEQLVAVKDVGASFAVAPGFNRDIVAEAQKMGFPFAPGVMTPSEIEVALAMGCRVLKFYHAGVAGGLSALKSMAAPYAHLGMTFIPLGGVNEQNLKQWAGDPLILAIGGSWIAPRSDIADGNFEAITRRAAQAVAIVEQERQK